MKLTCALLLSGMIAAGFAAEIEQQEVNPGTIRVVPVDPSIEPNHVRTIMMFPRAGQTVSSQPVSMQIRLDGFPLRNDTILPRRKEVYNDPWGQSLHIVIDDFPYISENEASVDALDDSEEYFEQKLEFSLPMHLRPGMHVVRIFPVRSYNESLKGDGSFTARIFYVDAKDPALNFDLHQPYLTYNEPQGHYNYSKTIPILLDFYLSNCELSRDGYKVRLTIDDEVERTLIRWTPYYLYGMPKGAHNIRLELLDEKNQPVPGQFNKAERTITIE